MYHIPEVDVVGGFGINGRHGNVYLQSIELWLEHQGAIYHLNVDYAG